MSSWKPFSELKEPKDVELAAATRLQERVRAKSRHTRERNRDDMARAFSTPSLDKAREHARSQLPHMPDGNLLPINCPMSCFRVFGKGVYCYMVWQRMMRDAMITALIMNTSNIISNLAGTGLESCSFYSCATIGNCTSITVSYAVVVAIGAGVLVYWCFVARNAALDASDAEHDADSGGVTTIAECTVIVYGLPDSATNFEHYREFFGEFGHVRHVVPSIATSAFTSSITTASFSSA